MIVRGFSVCSKICSRSSVKSTGLHYCANWRHFSAAVINNRDKKSSSSNCIERTLKLTNKKCILQILKKHGSPRHFMTCSRLYDEVKVKDKGDEKVTEEFSSSIIQQKGTENNINNTTNVVNLKNFEFTEFIPFFKTSKHTMLVLVLILKLRLANVLLMLTYVTTGIYSANAGTLNSVHTGSGIALLSLGVLTLLSIPCTRLVGNMSVDKDCRILRIQHLDGLGRKKSAYFDPDDFVHIMDLPNLSAFRRKSAYYPVKTYSFVNDQKFNTSHIFGKILDADIYTRVFGPIKFR